MPVEPAHTLTGALMVESGRGLIATTSFWLPTVAQPLGEVIEQFRITEAPDPALKVRIRSVWPAVIVPPLMVQA